MMFQIIRSAIKAILEIIYFYLFNSERVELGRVLLLSERVMIMQLSSKSSVLLTREE